MTDTQIAEAYDVVFDGRGYLCVDPCPPRADHDGVLSRETAPDVQAPRGANRALVLRAMPGTVRELQAGTGVPERAVYAVIDQLRRSGQLVTSKELRARVVYSILREGW